MEAGAEVNVTDRWGTSLLEVAFEEREAASGLTPAGSEIVRILLGAGAEIDFPTPTPEIAVIDRSDSSLTISVSTTGGETHFAVRRRNATESGEWVDFEVHDTDGRFEDQGLNDDSIYFYALQACNANGCSEPSSAGRRDNGVFRSG